MPDQRSRALDTLRAFAVSLPGAFEDRPWVRTPVAKVGKKIFVFFGTPADPDVSVKLPESAEQARSVPGATPTGYGLGRHGWVSVPVGRSAPLELLQDWIEESYRAIATKTPGMTAEANA